MSIKKINLNKSLGVILIICAIVGLVASFALSYDQIKILQNPNYKPSCNLNPIVSCGNVMQSSEGDVFGFPNPFIGLAAFGALLAVGAGMIAGAKYKRWFMLALEAGAVFGIVFVHWLFFESVYRISALCPYCMSVWLITIVSFWYISLYNIDNKYIVLKNKSLIKCYKWVRKHHLDIVVLCIIVIAFLIIKHFWYYIGHHL